MQQALTEFTSVQGSRTAWEIKDSNVVAGSLQEIFARAQLSQETDERRGVEELCEALRSKRFVFLYDSKNVRFGHGLWRFLSRPFCKYVDINEINAYRDLIETIKTPSRPKPQEEERPAFPKGKRDLNQRIAELDQLLQTSEAQKDQSDRRVAELGEQLDAEKKRSTGLEQTVAEQTAQIAELSKQLNRAREENAALQAHAREGEQEQVLGLKKELQAKEQTLKASQAKTARLSEEIERIRQENKAAAEAVPRAQREREGETEQERQLAAQIAELTVRAEQRSEALQASEARIQEIEQRLSETEAQRQTLEQQNQKLTAQSKRPKGGTIPPGSETLIAELEEIRQRQQKSEIQVASLEKEAAKLTADLGAERAKLSMITRERNRLSFAQVESLHQSLKAAFPPSSGWGQWGKKDRFIELRHNDPQPVGTESFWVFSEKGEDGQVAVFINSGRNPEKWNPVVTTLPSLVNQAKEAPGILWYS